MLMSCVVWGNATAVVEGLEKPVLCNIPLLINTKISDWKRLLAGAYYGLPMSPEQPACAQPAAMHRPEARTIRGVSPIVSDTWEGNFCGLRGWMLIGLNCSLCGILSGSKSRSTGTKALSCHGLGVILAVMGDSRNYRLWDASAKRSGSTYRSARPTRVNRMGCLRFVAAPSWVRLASIAASCRPRATGTARVASDRLPVTIQPFDPAKKTFRRAFFAWARQDRVIHRRIRRHIAT